MRPSAANTPYRLPPRLFNARCQACWFSAGVLALVVASFWSLDLQWAQFLSLEAARSMGRFLAEFFPPDTHPDFLRKVLPLVLLAVLIYTLIKKELGREHAPALQGWREAAVAGAIGLLMGFYDGFFGPGTGSLLVFLFVRVLGYDFLHASASAKLINTATNFSALMLFAWTGHVWWHLALAMALANVAGSLIGTRLALRHGAGFVRQVFILVVLALVLKTGWDTWLA